MAGSKQIHLGFIVFTFFLLCLDPTPIRAEGSGAGHKIEFEYKAGTKKGPEHWGDLKKEWKTCKTGKTQSPIDLRDGIATKVNSSLEHFKISYKPTKAIMKNEGPAIVVVWEGDAGSISINGKEYNLRQCHWHSPSEHSINGKRYDVELHMVHRAKNNSDVAVVGFLYKIGQPNPFISKVRKAIASMVDVQKDVHLGVIDPRKMKKAKIGYSGSFTTPPCSEGVTWTINKQVHTVSISQVKLLQQAVFNYAEMNARPVQPLNGREVKLHGSSFVNLKN
ncbi:alpha carbonic anhydrase 7-like isoform X1 [Prunus yedoensis var. nudiflora]|uniref:Carbonic anhydrase n=1 Tax=Prunus yedoensis var. nudiflora TaxID=2094558 RepID=A0A314XX94_PRUYE|nr:alpha carbonic anhydrase 7-like isoform X1 [Prunus yedoensis var. nudiflora]